MIDFRIPSDELMRQFYIAKVDKDGKESFFTFWGIQEDYMKEFGLDLNEYAALIEKGLGQERKIEKDEKLVVVGIFLYGDEFVDERGTPSPAYFPWRRCSL